jgi:ABC-type glutathione transport system ATPase component
MAVIPLVDAAALEKRFPVGRSLRQALSGQRPAVRAVDGIDLRLLPGESVGLVGESGSGKTTVGRLLLKLTEPSDGAIMFGGERLDAMQGPRLRQFRQQAQLVFQNPFDAINPRFTIRRAVAEPLVNTRVPKAEHEDRIIEALRLVHLPDPARTLGKRPSEMSGAGPGVGGASAVPGGRRTRVDAGCVGARRHPEPDARTPGPAGADGALHLP